MTLGEISDEVNQEAEEELHEVMNELMKYHPDAASIFPRFSNRVPARSRADPR